MKNNNHKNHPEVVDASDLKKKIAELELRERKYRKIFEESMDPIFLLDKDFRFIMTNHSLRQLFGFSTKQLNSLSLKTFFIHENDFKSFRKSIFDYKRTEEYEVILKTNQGIEKTCLINSVLFEEDASTYQYLGVIRDITKRKQAERKLLQVEKLSITGKIARTIAHEVRNPLTNLTLALSQLEDEIPAEVEDADIYLNIIKRNADRIGNLITDLLNSAKPKSVQLKKQSINGVITETIELVKDRIKLKKMKLHLDLEKEIKPILIDASLMKTALLNLSINAIEAMKPSQGILTIKTHHTHDEVIITIADNGKGIDPEHKKNLFEPYFTEKQSGAGLGLTTVQNIIHSHHGHIEVDSIPRKGTSFVISLPHST